MKKSKAPSDNSLEARELALLSTTWLGTSAVVKRALKLLDANEFVPGREESFARRLGMSALQLRRLFLEELGQTPERIFETNRLNFARKLVVETKLPLTDVALAAGFSSLRGFNAAFKNRFNRSPRKLRTQKSSKEKDVRLHLPYQPPLHWEALLNFFRVHEIRGVETVGDGAYERVFRHGNRIGHARVSLSTLAKNHLELWVTIDDPTALPHVVANVRRMFDLDVDPLLLEEHFAAHPVLMKIARKHPGLRLARGWDPFESSIATILGQLVSLAQARRLVAQLVKAYGERVSHPLTREEAFLFPTPKVLAEAKLDEVGTTTRRKATIREFSRLVADGEIDLRTPQDPATIKQQLLEIPGIGPWSAEYMSLRALGDTDAFPGTDLVLKRALDRHSDIDFNQTSPWRAYTAVYLWKEYASALADAVTKEKRK